MSIEEPPAKVGPESGLSTATHAPPDGGATPELGASPDQVAQESDDLAGVIGSPLGRALRLGALVALVVLLGVTSGLSMLIVVAAIIVLASVAGYHIIMRMQSVLTWVTGAVTILFVIIAAKEIDWAAVARHAWDAALGEVLAVPAPPEPSPPSLQGKRTP